LAILRATAAGFSGRVFFFRRGAFGAGGFLQFLVKLEIGIPAGDRSVIRDPLLFPPNIGLFEFGQLPGQRIQIEAHRCGASSDQQTQNEHPDQRGHYGQITTPGPAVQQAMQNRPAALVLAVRH